MNCSLHINGNEQKLEIDAEDTLLTILRDRLSLLGAKRGCNQGVCGACTVLVDGLPVRACLSLAANCEGTRITTIEALEHDELGRRLQRSLVEGGAVQCGFCTAGMLMTAYQLLCLNSSPSVEEIRAGLAGNLCRCTGYRKIVDAIQQAAREAT